MKKNMEMTNGNRQNDILTLSRISGRLVSAITKIFLCLTKPSSKFFKVIIILPSRSELNSEDSDFRAARSSKHVK